MRRVDEVGADLERLDLQSAGGEGGHDARGGGCFSAAAVGSGDDDTRNVHGNTAGCGVEKNLIFCKGQGGGCVVVIERAHSTETKAALFCGKVAVLADVARVKEDVAVTAKAVLPDGVQTVR